MYFPEQMVNVVMQKGAEGMKKFLDVLEYVHPNVFAHITQNEASSEPAGTVNKDDTMRIEKYLL